MVPAMPPVVHLRNAVALTGRFPALAGVDLAVEPGSVVVLEGSNGAGKTSVLRACAGLLAVTSGAIEVLGCNLRADRTAVRRRVGMLGHAAALYDDLTVVESVRFAVRAAGGDLAGLDAVLDRLELSGRLRRTAVGRLSAGQRRRVDLAALVARRPELWLLDEPHASLDAAGRDLVDAVIRDAAAGGATVLVASHELQAVVPLADQVVTLAGGRVADCWSPAGADVGVRTGVTNVASAGAAGGVPAGVPGGVAGVPGVPGGVAGVPAGVPGGVAGVPGGVAGVPGGVAGVPAGVAGVPGGVAGGVTRVAQAGAAGGVPAGVAVPVGVAAPDLVTPTTDAAAATVPGAPAPAVTCEAVTCEAVSALPASALPGTDAHVA
jgi:heme ABC exporter ATP-binding subunit CcmA